MKKNTSPIGRFNPRLALSFVLGLAGVFLAMASMAPPSQSPAVKVASSAPRPQHYMPVPGGEADDLDRMEQEWNIRLTYPTGIFNPQWLRLAAAADALITRAIPAGIPFSQAAMAASPLALTTTGFTALGPAPERMTGCTVCFDYTFTQGRVNAIAVDPTTTTPGTIVAYLGSVGGGVWKTTACCTPATTWSVTTDDPLLATVSIDALTIDPGNHNTIYAGTGDLNFGSFSMGSQGILKSTDAGGHWTTLGATVFGPALPTPVGTFPQYNAVGKVRVDPNNSSNVVAGTKTGLYLSYDGGNNWTGPCTTNNFSTQRQDITGLELIKQGSNTKIIAAVGVRGFATTVQYNLNQNGANGIYKGTIPVSGCPTDFTSIATEANGWTGMNAASGTPYASAGVGDQLGRIDIAVAPSNANYIYAQVQSITPNNNSGNPVLGGGCNGAKGCQLAAWRTTNGGNTWAQVPGSPGNSLKDCSTQFGADYPQNWYDQGVAVDPNNPNRVFFDTFEIWFWADGNTTWNDTTCGYSTVDAPLPLHVDQHALAFVPGSSSILLAGSDGGVYAAVDADQASATVKPTWFNMDLGLNTIEFYSGDISANFATDTAPQANGGAQDNGSSSVTFTGSPTGPVQWQMGIGGDGFYARIDPVGVGGTSPSNRMWQGGNSGHLSRCISSCTTGQAVWNDYSGGWLSDIRSFTMPYEIFKGDLSNPANDCGPAGPTTGCGHLIVGTTKVWETINGTIDDANAPPTWYINGPDDLTKGTLADRSYINQLAFEPKDQTIVIVGTNDGNVQIGFGMGSGSDSSTWVNVTGNNVVLPNRPILDVAFDPTTTTAPKAYAAVGGFNANTPTTTGHVFQVTCTANCATSVWSNKTGNLPDIPVDSIIANPKFPTQVFAGTDWGLYYTNDITAVSPTWYRFENGLPHVMIWDMQIDRGNTTLSVWTRGRGAYAWPLPSAVIIPPPLTSVVSRFTHGAVTPPPVGPGDISLTLPVGATPRAVEPRSSASAGTGNYQLVFTFANALTSVGGAGVTNHNPANGTGSVSGAPVMSGNTCTINLTGVSNAQYIQVTLTGVTDVLGNSGDVLSPELGILIGDVNGNGVLTNADVSLVKAQVASGGSVTTSNFRDDVNANGVITNADVSVTKAQVAAGTQLPSTP
jgi:hypothetical protein